MWTIPHRPHWTAADRPTGCHLTPTQVVVFVASIETEDPDVAVAVAVAVAREHALSRPRPLGTALAAPARSGHRQATTAQRHVLWGPASSRRRRVASSRRRHPCLPRRPPRHRHAARRTP